MHTSHHFSHFYTDKKILLFFNKCLILYAWMFVFVCVFADIKMCEDLIVCVSQGTYTGPNCNSVLLAAVTIGYNPSEPSFALVYIDIKPHTLCGILKCTSSDSTAIHSHLDTHTKEPTMAHLLFFPLFKEGCLPV